MTVDIRVGDCLDVLRTLDAESVQARSIQCCVCSPPYFGLRDYGVVGQIGLEATPDAYVAKLVEVFREVRRVLRDDGTLWLNLGDSYAGGGHGSGGSYELERDWRKGNPDKNGGASSRDGLGRITGLKPKDLIGIPWRVAFALQADGWYLRSDIIWSKPNPMPESVTDRPTKAHEYLFLLSKQERYFYDSDAIAETCEKGDAGAGDRNYRPGTNGNQRKNEGQSVVDIRTQRNRRTVWTVATQPYSGAHFATFPPALIEPCILAGSRVGDTVLDPFAGAGTTGLVADRLSRNALLIELNPQYAKLARRRIHDDAPLFSDGVA